MATCFGSIEPSSGQIQDTVLVHSASAYSYTKGSHIVYNCIDIIDHFGSVSQVFKNKNTNKTAVSVSYWNI